MKKFLFLGTLMTALLVFSFTAVAQEVTCDTCKGFSLSELDCPTGVQDETCSPVSIDWPNIIFPVCECPDADDEFQAGTPDDPTLIGVRMIILTPVVY